MISAVNFNGKVATGYIQGEKNSKGERVIIMDKPEEGVVKKTVKSAAYIRKGYITAKEGLFGFASATVTGMVAGGATMGIGWLFNKVAKGEFDKDFFLTPWKTAGNIVVGITQKAAKVFDKDKSFIDILKYPFTGLPRDIAKYVQKHSCNKFTGFMAVGVGLAAATTVVLSTLIKINRAKADVDHGFRVGHNK